MEQSDHVQAQSTCSGAQTGLPKKGRAGKLRLLPNMPLDILLEIFGWMEPKGLVNLVRVNKACRDTLLAPNSAFIWKAARQRLGAPDPLIGGFTEAGWCKFIFGGSFCEICGVSGTRGPDFGIMKKVCRRCQDENVVVEGEDWSTLKLVQYTTYAGISSKRAVLSTGNRRFYWNDHVQEVKKSLEVLQQACLNGEEDAQICLDAYRTERLEFVAAAEKHRNDCQAWYFQWSDSHRREQREEIRTRELRRIEAIQARFLNLGYIQSDLAQIFLQKEVKIGSALVTDHGWEQLRKKFEHLAKHARDQRLRDEHAKLEAKRIQEISDSIPSRYTAYKTMVSPREWPFLPRCFDLLQMSGFKDAFCDPKYSDQESIFPQFITRFLDQRRIKLWDEVKAQGLFASSCLSFAVMDDLDSKTSLSILSLATVVCACKTLDCSGGTPIIAWDGALRHQCVDRLSGAPGITDLEFSRHGSTLAASLIRQAGLDPYVASPWDMDSLEIYYRCEFCVSQSLMFGTSGAAVYQWREAIHHHLACNLSHSRFLVVDKSELIAVTTVPSQEKDWMCLYCTEHLNVLETYERVLDHVKFCHGIAEPIVEQDFVLGPGRMQSPMTPGTLMLDLSATCLDTQLLQYEYAI
ncbi:hypothetical protein C8J56DRAFT_971627 [Mycena floridula]|nr:hypothetical protein C8J56DRAFT_971627 [Mycena floridula]